MPTLWSAFFSWAFSSVLLSPDFIGGIAFYGVFPLRSKIPFSCDEGAPTARRTL